MEKTNEKILQQINENSCNVEHVDLLMIGGVSKTLFNHLKQTYPSLNFMLVDINLPIKEIESTFSSFHPRRTIIVDKAFSRNDLALMLSKLKSPKQVLFSINKNLCPKSNPNSIRLQLTEEKIIGLLGNFNA